MREGIKAMNGKYLLAAVLVIFLCVGCGQDESKKSNKVGERPPASTGQDQIFTQGAMDKINQVAGPMIEKAEKTTGEVVAQVVEKTEMVRKRSGEFATALKEESAPMMKKTGSALIVAGEKVQEVAEVMSAKEKIVIDNKKGKVTLPHRVHGKSFGCAACHGNKEPGAMELGKEKAHKLCKDCHKKKGKGPTKCSGCHEKKIIEETVEGC